VKRSRPLRIVTPEVIAERMAEDWSLAERAARNFPDQPALQIEWIRAVKVVRSTSGGWLIERKAERVRP